MKAKEKTRELIDQLAEGIKSIKSSDEFKAVLDSMANFHSYSMHNTILIYMQRPTATRVAGFRTWQKMGRFVKKGEKGIAILAPAIYKKKTTEEDSGTDEETKTKTACTYFFPVHVFDVSQTEGEELPGLNWKQIEDTHSETLEKLLALAKQNSIEVEFQELASCEGVSFGGKVVIQKNKNATEQSLILIHELAHEMLHKDPEKRPKLSREQKEMEAEATAYVVASALGIPKTNSERYLALYSRSYDLKESLEAIHETSQKILKAVISAESEESDE